MVLIIFGVGLFIFVGVVWVGKLLSGFEFIVILLLVVLGELVCEKSGVFNFG